ncbi:MAG: tetratricopeptide repeat protein [Fidelibacterota bacterium]|nr:MAG: tetratricopeptide repeat protein [Candidatus Neomarinimicrobiota bacterium]
MKNSYLLFPVLLVAFWIGCQSDDVRSDAVGGQAGSGTIDSLAIRYLIRAEMAYHQGVHYVALMLTDSIDMIEPDLPDAYFLRGLAYSALRRYRMAEISYQRVLSIEPNYEGAWYNLGGLALRTNNPSKALSCFKKELERHKSPQSYLQMGWIYMELEEADSAQWAFKKAIKADKNLTSAYMRLSELYKKEGNQAKALKFARKGLNIEPNNLNYQYYLASIYLEDEKPEKALPYLETAVEGMPWHYQGHHDLAQALIRLGRPDEANYYFKIADSLKIILDKVVYWQNMAEANPDQIGLWINLGNTLHELGRNADAVNAYNVAISLDPIDMDVRNNLANLCIMAGDTVSAMSHYLTILDLDPGYADAWFNLGIAYAESGQYEAARNAWLNTLKYDPTNEMAEEYLATLPEVSP